MGDGYGDISGSIGFFKIKLLSRGTENKLVEALEVIGGNVTVAALDLKIGRIAVKLKMSAAVGGCHIY